MVFIKKIYRIIKIRLLFLRNYIYKIIHHKSFYDNISLLSCDKWKNNIKEDLNLQYFLLKKGIDANIISWESDKLNCKNVIIRSIWGYQNKIDNFIKYIEDLQKNNINIINSYDIIKNNFYKNIQFDLFKKYGIKHINADIVYKTEDLIKKINCKEKLVIKPCISASGNNTFTINGTGKNNIDIKDIADKYRDIVNNGIIVQPFVDEIINGEISVIIIDGKIINIVNRYPGIFTNKCIIEEMNINNVDQKIKLLIKDINKIDEYKHSVFMRVDLIKILEDYYVMEIELLEPQLFLEWISNKNEKNHAYLTFAEAIISNISK